MQLHAFSGHVYPPADPDELSRGYATPKTRSCTVATLPSVIKLR